jgi:hypothetical protein
MRFTTGFVAARAGVMKMEETRCFECNAPAVEWFCDRSCAVRHRNKYGALKKPKRQCLACGEAVADEARRTAKFCKKSCSARYRNQYAPSRKRGKFAECVGCGARIAVNNKRCVECRSGADARLTKEMLEALVTPPENRGNLELRSTGYVGGFFRREGARSVKKRRQLYTAVESLAWWRMWRLTECEDLFSEDVKREETFAEAVKRVVWIQKTEDGLKSWKVRLSRLWRFAVPALGKLPVREVRAPHIKGVLTAAKGALGKQSVSHLKADLSSIFQSLAEDDLVVENVVRGVRLPKKLRHDKRRRVQLTDDEFEQLVSAPTTPAYLRLMCCSARLCGGMRTSDLHAWDWQHVETDTFTVAEVPRPKTDDPNEVELAAHELPPLLRALLREHWLGQGRPLAGPVFPVRRGANKGRRQGKRSHARALRHYLRLAGCVRPALFQDTIKTRAVDFHSFRRAYNTALAAVGVSEQQAMALMDHSDSRVHRKYVDLVQRGVLKPPSNALPGVAQRTDWRT